jgi:hypothetical protein
VCGTPSENGHGHFGVVSRPPDCSGHQRYDFDGGVRIREIEREIEDFIAADPRGHFLGQIIHRVYRRQINNRRHKKNHKIVSVGLLSHPLRCGEIYMLNQTNPFTIT